MRVSVLVGLCGLLAASGAAQATTYSLSNDFSNVNNPNGVWSFAQGTTALPHQAQPTDGNGLDAAAANGYWGVASTFQFAPFIIKTTQNGGSTPTYSNNDFLAGDVIVHSTNPGAGLPMFVNWTAPSAGQLSLSSALWYAHSPVNRQNEVSVLLDGVLLGMVTINNTVPRGSANTSLSWANLSVAAGDVIAFRFMPSSGQDFGSLTGISETINFTAAVPEPATWATMIAGLAMAGGVARRRRRGVDQAVSRG